MALMSVTKDYVPTKHRDTAYRTGSGRLSVLLHIFFALERYWLPKEHTYQAHFNANDWC